VFLLDTNAVISILTKPSGPVAARMRRHRADTIVTSAIVAHELYFGAFNSLRTESNLASLEELGLAVLPFDRDDAREAGIIRALLSRQGRPIGPYDALIAGQARARGLVVVSRNIREFSRVPELSVENWQLD
jgi:tRNA(fMet)-specific endonuclease VapC